MCTTTQQDKGTFRGTCNRTACQRSNSANYYNHSTRMFYCEECANLINLHNAKDSMQMFGHELCTSLVAITRDGMRNETVVPVTKISAWLSREDNGGMTTQHLATLLQQAASSRQMHIYVNSPAPALDGKITASDSTPLYTNGQQQVIALYYDGSIIWKR